MAKKRKVTERKRKGAGDKPKELRPGARVPPLSRREHAGSGRQLPPYPNEVQRRLALSR